MVDLSPEIMKARRQQTVEILKKQTVELEFFTQEKSLLKIKVLQTFRQKTERTHRQKICTSKNRETSSLGRRKMIPDENLGIWVYTKKLEALKMINMWTDF